MSGGPLREAKPRRSRAGGIAHEIRAVDPGSWGHGAIIVALKDWERTVGRPPRAHEWAATTTGPGSGSARRGTEHPRWPSAATLVHHFGCWTEGLRVIGLPVSLVEHDRPMAAGAVAACG